MIVIGPAGVSTACQMRKTLIVNALEMHRLHGYVQPNAMLHSHIDSTFTSKYAKYYFKTGVHTSMAGTLACRDDGEAENLFAKLKGNKANAMSSRPKPEPSSQDDRSSHHSRR